MKIAIKNPAPLGKNLERWGDYHFGQALMASLVRQGADATQHFWPKWGFDGEDVAIWLRGKRRCTPIRGIVNGIWILSHPASVTNGELAGFDLVFAASEALANALTDRRVAGVALMRQCTDTRQFKTDLSVQEAEKRGLLFVASSRGVSRPILRWAVAAGLTPTLVGHGWQQVGLGDLVQADYVSNATLPRLYNAAKYGMNDHWGDMAHYQMINNRIFDGLACGLPIISDGFPELHRIVGDAVWIVDGSHSFRDAYWAIRLDYSAARQQCLEWWRANGADYSFDARADQIMRSLSSASALSRSQKDNRPSATSASQAIEALFERRGGLGNNPVRITTSLLHICPSQETSGAVSALPSLSRVAVGIGDGPWEARIDLDQEALGCRMFDVIYCENLQGQASVEEVAVMLVDLLDHLKVGGLISALDPRTLDVVRRDRRMAEVSQVPLVLRRTVGEFPRQSPLIPRS